MAAKCPKCKSDDVAIVQKGFDSDGGTCGCCLFGPIGLLLGFLGSGGVRGICQSCGHKWQVGGGSNEVSPGASCLIIAIAVFLFFYFLGGGCS